MLQFPYLLHPVTKLILLNFLYILCMTIIHSPGSVGIGTIIAAVLVGTVLKLITRFFGKARDALLHI